MILPAVFLFKEMTMAKGGAKLGHVFFGNQHSKRGGGKLMAAKRGASQSASSHMGKRPVRVRPAPVRLDGVTVNNAIRNNDFKTLGRLNRIQLENGPGTALGSLTMQEVASD
jgi:hypothetical protein